MRRSRSSKLSLATIFVLLAATVSAQTEHIIQRGETLYSIARFYKIELSALQGANSISDPSKIRVGQKLIIPDGSSMQPSAVSTSTQSYVVKAGDTFYGIARTSEISVDDLLALNKLPKNSTLRVGQNLLIPAKAGSQIVIAPSPAANPTPRPTVTPTPTSNGNQVPVNLGGNSTRQTEGANLKWPHPGDRFAVQGKLPGVVIHAKQGDNVVAVSGGRVAYSGPHATLGHVIFVQGNNGYVYIYGGNGDSPLKLGDVVNPGDKIGTVGVTPGIKEAQVYFGVWKKGAYINPAVAPRD